MTKAKSASRTYLKVLGIIILILGILTVIGGVAVMAAGNLNDTILKVNGIDELTKDMSVDTVRIVAGGLLAASGIFQGITGIVLRNSAKDGGKTTLALVLVVLCTISAAYTLFAQKFQNLSATQIINLAAYVLALIVLFNVRSDNK